MVNLSSTHVKIQDLVDIAIQGGDCANELIRGSFSVIEKEDGNNATTADVESEKLVKELLGKSYPNIPIIAEESTSEGIEIPLECFIVDNIDGTNHASRGGSDWVTMLAYMKNGSPILSAVYQPRRKRLVYAEIGTGCWLRDWSERSANEIRLDCTCEINAALNRPVLGTDFSSGFTSGIIGPLIEELHKKKLIFGQRSLLTLGGSAIDLVTGLSDIYFCPKVAYIWDCAAPFVIVKEAGGIATDQNGQECSWDRLRMGVIFARNKQLFDSVFPIIRKLKGLD